MRHALRSLRKNPGFTLLAILTLALGIGANTAIFSIINSVLLSPLRYPDADRIVAVSTYSKQTGHQTPRLTGGDLVDIRGDGQAFEALSCYFGGEMGVQLRDRAEFTGAFFVDPDFFRIFGAQPAYGRLLDNNDQDRAALVSLPFAERNFGSGPNALSKLVSIENRSYQIAGVLPVGFQFPSKADVWVLAPPTPENLNRTAYNYPTVAKLKSGVTLEGARIHLETIGARVATSFPDSNRNKSFTVTPLRDQLVGPVRTTLYFLMGAVVLVLLIACTNVADLMLARATARSREMAVRAALGAGRWHIIRPLLAESAILAIAGGALGLLLAQLGTNVLLGLAQDRIPLPRLDEVHIDRLVLAFVTGVSLLSSLLFGLAPALEAARVDPQQALQQGGSRGLLGARSPRLRNMLVVAQIALSFVLAISAGLLLRSFLRVLDVDLGFQPSRAAVIKIDYDDGNDRNSRVRRGAILREMLRNIDSIPGVEASGVADMLPLGRNRSWGFQAKGKQYPEDMALAALVRIVTPGYLGAMGMHLLEGRDFNWQDTDGREAAVIVNQAAARRFWPGEDPVGRLALVNGDTRVIGVIRDVREHSLEFSAQPEMYLSAAQADPEGAELVIRTKLPPEVLASSVMKTLRSLNPAQPAAEFRPLQQIVDHAVSPRRFFVMLVASFALLGLVLASLGIYGVISYSVTRQMQEIGIRMALGATAFQVQRGVIARALRLALAGVTLGTIGSFAAAKWIASLLFGTRPTDPATFAGIVVLLCVVALFAGYLPARRASRIDPMIALRTN